MLGEGKLISPRAGGASETWCATSAPERLQETLVQEAARHRAQVLVSARNADEARDLVAAYAALCPQGASARLEILLETDFRQVWTPVP